MTRIANAKANNFSITRFPAAQLSTRISQKNLDKRQVENRSIPSQAAANRNQPIGSAANHSSDADRNKPDFSHLEQ
jgi:hypothetical protein